MNRTKRWMFCALTAATLAAGWSRLIVPPDPVPSAPNTGVPAAHRWTA